MAEITAALVAKLREMTNAGLMDCKKALSETSGDLQAAVDVLRKKGVATAAKKAGRDAREGVIAAYIAPGARLGLLVEVNCETDFVAKNETFRAFSDDVARRLATDPSGDLEGIRTEYVAKIGENIQIKRHHRLEVTGNGLIAAYIHTGAKVGVLLEVGAGKDTSPSSEAFKQLVRDITLQIAAASPAAISRSEVAADLVEKEREIAGQSEAVKNKPPQAVAKIIEGKLNKFYETACLLEQGFVKNPELKVEAHIASVAKSLGDELVVRKFLRWQLGEVA